VKLRGLFGERERGRERECVCVSEGVREALRHVRPFSFSSLPFHVIVVMCDWMASGDDVVVLLWRTRLGETLNFNTRAMHDGRGSKGS
jgi:hypothetical protein